MRFNPAPDDRIEAGDFLIAMGEPRNNCANWNRRPESSMKIVSAAEMRESIASRRIASACLRLR